MLRLIDIRDYIAGLGIAKNENVYIGKLDNKKTEAIGIYSRATSGRPVTALGGAAYSSYGIKPISLLIHWNKHIGEAEQAANELFERLRAANEAVLGDTVVQQFRLMVPEPQSIGSDDNGVYEYVIWIDFIYQRKRGNEV